MRLAECKVCSPNHGAVADVVSDLIQENQVQLELQMKIAREFRDILHGAMGNDKAPRISMLGYKLHVGYSADLYDIACKHRLPLMSSS